MFLLYNFLRRNGGTGILPVAGWMGFTKSNGGFLSCVDLSTGSDRSRPDGSCRGPPLPARYEIVSRNLVFHPSYNPVAYQESPKASSLRSLGHPTDQRIPGEPTKMIRSFKGKTPTLGQDVYVDSSAQVIGNVTLGDRSSLWCNVVARGDVHFIRIGERTNIQDGSVCHVTEGNYPLIIGSNVTVGHRVILHGCTVADHVLVGMGAIILDGATVGEYSMVAAGSLVPPGMMVPPGTLVMGSPARVKRDLGPVELTMIDDGATGYDELRQIYLQLGTPGAPAHE